MAIEYVILTDTFDDWRVKNNSLADLVGDLDTLLTTEKSSVVSSINELLTNSQKSGDLANLDTDVKSTVVGAINEVNTNADLNSTNLAALTVVVSDIDTSVDSRIAAQDAEIDLKLNGAKDNLLDYGPVNFGVTVDFDALTYDSYLLTLASPTFEIACTNLAVGRKFNLVLDGTALVDPSDVTWPTEMIWYPQIEPEVDGLLTVIEFFKISATQIIGNYYQII